MQNDRSTRREFVRFAGAAGLLGPSVARAVDDSTLDAPDVALRITPVQFEVARGQTVATVGYNGAVPGPVVRFREGVSTTVELTNETDIPEYVHWHGFEIPADVDGAEEEHSRVVPAHGRIRYRLTPSPAGSRYVHSHAMAMENLGRGTFTGQFAFAWIEPRNDPGRYDQEIFLATHEWGPYWTSIDQTDDGSAPDHETPAKEEGPHGHSKEVGYRYYTINGRCLGFGEPIRVKQGQHVLFHFLNASATESVRFAMPGHSFQVVALDGNPVPRPQRVAVLSLGTGERIDAIVQMDAPGVYVLGTPDDDHRAKGMGIVVEYANASGKPRWVKPPESAWDYAIFGGGSTPSPPDATIPLVIRQAGENAMGVDRWTINGKSYLAGNAPTPLMRGKRYFLVIENQTDDAHPVHLHRNNFELVDLGGKPTAGIVKDVVVVRERQKVQVAVTPASPGLTLFHCHQQLHMDNGFKLLFDVV